MCCLSINSIFTKLNNQVSRKKCEFIAEVMPHHNLAKSRKTIHQFKHLKEWVISHFKNDTYFFCDHDFFSSSITFFFTFQHYFLLSPEQKNYGCGKDGGQRLVMSLKIPTWPPDPEWSVGMLNVGRQCVLSKNSKEPNFLGCPIPSLPCNWFGPVTSQMSLLICSLVGRPTTKLRS